MTEHCDIIEVQQNPDGQLYLSVKWGSSTRRFLINPDLAAKLRIDIGKAIGVEYIPPNSVVFVGGDRDQIEQFRELVDLALKDPDFRVITNLDYTIVPADQVKPRSRDEMFKQWIELGEELDIPTVEVAISERVKAAYAEGWRQAFDPGELSHVEDLDINWEHSKARAGLTRLHDEPELEPAPLMKMSRQLGQ
jgi:hypothetical protein